MAKSARSSHSSRKIILPFVLSSLAAVLTAVVYLDEVLRRQEIEQWEESARLLADSLSQRIEREIDLARTDLVFLASTPAFAGPPAEDRIDLSLNGIPEDADPARREILDLFLRNQERFSVLFVLLPDGRHYISHPFAVQRTLRKYDLSDRPYVQEAIRTGRPVVSDSFIGADGVLAVAIDVPIVSGDRIVSHLGGVFHLTKLSKWVARDRIGHFEGGFVVDRQGRLIAHTDASLLATDARERFVEHPMTARALERGAPATAAIEVEDCLDPVRGTVDRTAFRTLSSGWRLGLYQNRDRIRTGIRDRVGRIAALVASLFLAISGLGVVAAGRIGRQRDEAERALREAHELLNRRVEERTAALRESEERYALAQRVTGIGTWEWDLGSGRIHWSDQVWPNLGAAVGAFEPTRERILERIHPEDRGAFEAALSDSLRRGLPLAVEFRVLDESRDVRWVSVRGEVFRDDAGAPRRMLGVTEDVTVRRRDEEELHRIGMAIEQTSDMVLITDVRGSITYVNPAFERVTGYSREEVLGRNPRLLASGEHDRAFYERLWRTILGGRTWTGRLVNRRKDGDLYVEEATITPLSIPPGRTVSFVAVKRDITERIRLEEKLRQAEKLEAIGQLAGGVAHDFNNQLTGILGYAEVLARDSNQEPCREYASKILQAARRSADLTAKLLAFARKGRNLSVPVDLHRIVREVIEILERSIDKRILLRERLLAAPSTVRGDPTLLQNALLNLAINARDAMPDGGELVFETAVETLERPLSDDHGLSVAPGRYVVVAVADTGVGMEPPILRRIFEPFFTTKPEGRGTGMGLAAVHGTIESHAGAIQVESEPGRGTTFRIHLPAVDVPLEDAPAATPPAANGRRGKILVVDDDEVARSFTREVLARAGHDVTAIDDVHDALVHFEAAWRTTDLVILDLVMPKMAGDQAYERLRSVAPGVPVLLFSGFSLDGRVEALLAAGARGFLEKPFAATQLLREVDRILGS